MDTDQCSSLGSIPEEAQRPATLEDLANESEPLQGTPVSSDPATPSYSPFGEPEQQTATAEIDLATEHTETEQAGTAATDLRLVAEQVAMHAIFSYQVAAQEATTQGTQGPVQPSIQICSDLPREWPMARLCISNKQVNRYVRTALWRRVAEKGLQGTYFSRIPNEVHQELIGDLLLISNALAAPLAQLFAFVEQGHPSCAFIPTEHLALYANPLFWQYGLLAFVSGCCASNIDLLKRTTEAKADPAKQEVAIENEVDALTFMQTVIMSFVRGMTHGEQVLPINDLFVYLPVQVLPALVQSILDHQYQPIEPKSGGGYRTNEGRAADNPFLVVGACRKEMQYNNEPQMPRTPWAERAYVSRALDPSIGQSMSFPALPQLKLRVGVPLWTDPIEARHPPPQTHSGESDADSSITDAREPSPRFAQLVPVGGAESQELSEEGSTEEEDADADPTYLVPQRHGRFALRWSRLATAADNFARGNAQTESTIIANWLTSGLEVAMNRMGWYLLSSRQELTRLSRGDLYSHYHYGYPNCHEDDRPYQKYGDHVCSEREWQNMSYWLTGDPIFLKKLAIHRRELYEKTVGAKGEGTGRNKSRRVAPPVGTGSASSTARFPNRNRPPPPPPPRYWGPR